MLLDLSFEQIQSGEDYDWKSVFSLCAAISGNGHQNDVKVKWTSRGPGARWDITLSNEISQTYAQIFKLLCPQLYLNSNLHFWKPLQNQNLNSRQTVTIENCA